MHWTRPDNLKPAFHLNRWEWVALAIVLVVGLALRTWRLDLPVMWCDESESAINALTILQHGAPIDTYLGLPLYENVLQQPWPEHPEYEFRDSSYSHKGLAVYHAWLPLYSIAASQAAFGIQPDTLDRSLKAKFDNPTIARRTMAARVPAVVFGMLFLLAIFLLGQEMGGRVVAWTSLCIAAVAVPLVHIARQSRYYSATALLATVCCLYAWRIHRYGRWRDVVWGGLAYGLLFHTHVMTFAIAGAGLLLLCPFMLWRDRRFIWRTLAQLATFGIIVLAMSLPWAILTGFLQTAAKVPKAIEFLTWRDLLVWPLDRWPVTLLLGSGLVILLGVYLLQGTRWNRLVQPFYPRRHELSFLLAWTYLGYWAFVLLIPAASLSWERSWLSAVGPGIVFGSTLFVALGHAIGRRSAVALAGLAFIGFVLLNVRSNYSWQRAPEQHQRLMAMIDHMRQWSLNPGTRLYASPNDHLTLTYHTGLPVQSIAPVRKSFLDSYPGDIVYIECFVRLHPVSWKIVQKIAGEHGVFLNRQEARTVAQDLSERGLAHYLQEGVAQVSPSTDGLPDYAEKVFEFQRQYTHWRMSEPDNPFGMNPAVFKGFSLADYGGWWETFFYRFVEPARRGGKNANYADRMRNANLFVLPWMWTIYYSPGPAGNDNAVSSDGLSTQRDGND